MISSSDCRARGRVRGTGAGASPARATGRSDCSGALASAAPPISVAAEVSRARRVSVFFMGELLQDIGGASTGQDQPPRARIAVEDCAVIGRLMKHQAGAGLTPNRREARAGSRDGA